MADLSEGRSRPGRSTAWGVFGLCVLLTGAAVVVNQATPVGRPDVVQATLEDFVDAFASLTFPLVGALLVSRVGNRLGWIFGAVGLAMATSTVAAATANYRLATDHLTGVAVLQLLQEGLFGVFIGLILMLVPLLFPGGRLRSSRWRPALWAAVGWQVLALLVLFLTPGAVEDRTPAVVNPFGVDALRGALSVGDGVVSVLLVALPLVGLASLITGVVRPREGSRRSSVLLLAAIAAILFAFSLDGVLQPIIPGWGPIAPLLAIPAVPLATYVGLIRRRQPWVARSRTQMTNLRASIRLRPGVIRRRAAGRRQPTRTGSGFSRRRLVPGWWVAVFALVTVAAVASGCAPASGPGSSEPATRSGSAPRTGAPEQVSPTRPPTADDLVALGSDFTSTPTGWTWLDDTEGGPDVAGQPGVVRSVAGSLVLRPPTSTWFRDFRGPFLFQPVTGDVVLVVRLKVSGRHTAVPVRSYSLAGVMARAPQPPSELTSTGTANWTFVTTGTGVGHGVPQIELKDTRAGQSEVQLVPSEPGWVELALARVGDQMVAMYRLPDGSWTEGSRWLRRDLPATLQWGLIAYTDWDTFQAHNSSAARVNVGGVPGGSPDLVATVDRASFLRPHVPDGVDVARLDSPPLLKLLTPGPPEDSAGDGPGR